LPCAPAVPKPKFEAPGKSLNVLYEQWKTAGSAVK
jgi:hypothetical protein